MRNPPSLTERIHRRIRARGPGPVVVTRDFLGMGSRSAIDQALSRLARAGAIRRIARGVYDYPRESANLGITLGPVPDEVANTIAASASSRLQVAGAQAANDLGLSTQVPARIVYLTDGTARTVRLGNQTLVFRHASPRSMATAGRISGTVIQALRYLGKAHVNEDVIQQLRTSLSVQDKVTLKKDRSLAPGWMQPIIDQIVTPLTE